MQEHGWCNWISQKKYFHLFHNSISLDNVGTIFSSRSTKKVWAKTVPSGHSIAILSIFTYVLLFRVKSIFLVQRYSNGFISCFNMLLLVSYILLIIISIVHLISRASLSDTIWYRRGIFCFFSDFINDLILLILYCGSAGGFDNWAIYFPSL